MNFVTANGEVLNFEEMKTRTGMSPDELNIAMTYALKKGWVKKVDLSQGIEKVREVLTEGGCCRQEDP